VAEGGRHRVKNGGDILGLLVVDQLPQHIRKHEYRLGYLAFAVSQRVLPRPHRGKISAEDVRHRIDQKDAFHLTASLE
jgi:hypothetical protein